MEGGEKQEMRDTRGGSHGAAGPGSGMKMGGTDSKAMESGYEEATKEICSIWPRLRRINAYAPFSRFSGRSGAAGCRAARAYTGVNVENSSYRRDRYARSGRHLVEG